MRTLDPDRDSLLELVEQVRFTLFRLRRSKPGAAILTTWEDLYKAVRAALDTELSLVEGIADALAGVDWIDGELDVLILLIIKTVDKFPRHNEVLRRRLLKGKTPSAFTRPRLGEELASVEDWVEALKSTTQKELQDLATPLGTVIDAAKKTQTALTAANGLFADFRAIERRALYDRVNGERQVLYGQLIKVLGDDAMGGLPKDYVERHFKVGRSRAPGIQSVAAGKLAVAEAEQHLKDMTAVLKDLEAAAEAERLADEQRAADEKALQEQQRLIEEAQARADELKRRIDSR